MSDNRCFKCVEEMKKKNSGGAAANILFQKMSQGLANQNPDDIFICEKHK